MKISVRLHLNITKTNSDGLNPIVLEHSIDRVRKRKVLYRCNVVYRVLKLSKYPNWMHYKN